MHGRMLLLIVIVLMTKSNLFNKFFTTKSQVVEGEEIVNDPMTKSNLFNKCFTAKSQVPNSEEIPPHLDPIEGITPLDCISTSPIEISKVIRDNLKKSLFSNCGIPGKFLGLIATPISRPMTTLFNNIFLILGKSLMLPQFISGLGLNVTNQIFAQFRYCQLFRSYASLLFTIGYLNIA